MNPFAAKKEVDKSKSPFAGNVYCPNGPGGGKDPSCSPESGSGLTGSVSVRDSYGTRTPTMKRWINDVERGPLSYVASMSHDEAMKEVDKVEKLHGVELANLEKIAIGKADPQGQSEQEWRAAEARSGKVIAASEWATKLGIPAKQAYLNGIKQTRSALKSLRSRYEKKQKGAKPGV